MTKTGSVCVPNDMMETDFFCVPRNVTVSDSIGVPDFIGNGNNTNFLWVTKLTQKNVGQAQEQSAIPVLEDEAAVWEMFNDGLSAYISKDIYLHFYITLRNTGMGYFRQRMKDQPNINYIFTSEKKFLFNIHTIWL
ncbi:unnamed protein product [Macrosiphum euphorbiae]|uniref:Uncharacterized protein n=1 Tax=Macrosiphum euphorbiae TaxID=13131 RepID=A0AAV0WS03_9HEMI|nr:unnamed protein product [Macrosiphum euphorbiae]